MEPKPTITLKSNPKTKAPDTRDIDIGRRIRAQRLVRGMSQTDLGTRIGITFQQVQKYEKGVNRVGAGRLTRIAEVLGVPVGFLFGATEPGADGSSKDASAAFAFLETAGALRLVHAYADIKNPRIRRALVTLAEQIAGEPVPQSPDEP
jgi:transcriptional regulator with XRE-family HTH domain